MSQNLLAFNTPHDGMILVFDVPNAKYLAFGTPNGKVARLMGMLLKSNIKA